MNKIMELLKDIEEKAQELQVMIAEPASKEWLEKWKLPKDWKFEEPFEPINDLQAEINEYNKN